MSLAPRKKPICWQHWLHLWTMGWTQCHLYQSYQSYIWGDVPFILTGLIYGSYCGAVGHTILDIYFRRGSGPQGIVWFNSILHEPDSVNFPHVNSDWFLVALSPFIQDSKCFWTWGKYYLYSLYRCVRPEGSRLRSCRLCSSCLPPSVKGYWCSVGGTWRRLESSAEHMIKGRSL